jgi:NAD(P)H-hydrate epimerase
MSEIILTAQQAAEVDKYAKERLGIPTLVLMENAGRAVAEVALDLLGQVRNAHIAIFCGRGNNAGDGFVATRHLITRGKDVDVYLLAPHIQVRNEAEINLNILKKLTNRIFEIGDSAGLKTINFKVYTLIIDALLGIGLKGEVRGLFKEAISLINKSGVRTVAVDIPSGLDATSGEVCGIAIRADTTVTFVARKQGLLRGQGPEYCGKIIVRDLGIPVENLLEVIGDGSH